MYYYIKCFSSKSCNVHLLRFINSSLISKQLSIPSIIKWFINSPLISKQLNKQIIKRFVNSPKILSNKTNQFKDSRKKKFSFRYLVHRNCSAMIFSFKTSSFQIQESLLTCYNINIFPINFFFAGWKGQKISNSPDLVAYHYLLSIRNGKPYKMGWN